MRLIDADALKKKARMNGHCLRPMVTGYHMCVSTHDIDDAPTVDAEPVRHGRWIKRDIVPDYMWKYCCSCCHSDGERRYNYCPHCGAKMDEGVQ